MLDSYSDKHLSLFIYITTHISLYAIFRQADFRFRQFYVYSDNQLWEPLCPVKSLLDTGIQVEAIWKLWEFVIIINIINLVKLHGIVEDRDDRKTIKKITI